MLYSSFFCLIEPFSRGTDPVSPWQYHLVLANLTSELRYLELLTVYRTKDKNATNFNRGIVVLHIAQFGPSQGRQSFLNGVASWVCQRVVLASYTGTRGKSQYKGSNQEQKFRT